MGLSRNSLHIDPVVLGSGLVSVAASTISALGDNLCAVPVAPRQLSILRTEVDKVVWLPVNGPS